MFKIGEVVFCKLRGSGVVEGVETQTLLGEEKECMVIQMKFPELVIRIPVDRIEQSGFRKISSLDKLVEVETILSSEKVENGYTIDAKKRNKENQEKLATGDFPKCSEVVRDLTHMDQIKPLNNIEKNMLMQAKRLLVDEFAIIKSISTEVAEQQLNKLMDR